MRGIQCFRAIVILFVLVLAFAPFVSAQRTAGEIRGKVVDASAALIPGVSLPAKDLATGETRQAISNGVGSFVFPNLLPGVY